MTEGRHFFALWSDRRLQERLAREARQAAVRGRLHHQQDLHMTLVFLGPVAEAKLRCVEETADEIMSCPFSLCIDAIGYWPRPRILWAGPSEIPQPLSQLVFDLLNGLVACGFEAERRRYKPHVTLYRKAASAHPAVIEPAIEWPVREFVLAVSGGAAPGEPRYRVLKRWPLQGVAPMQ